MNLINLNENDFIQSLFQKNIHLTKLISNKIIFVNKFSKNKIGRALW